MGDSGEEGSKTKKNIFIAIGVVLGVILVGGLGYLAYSHFTGQSNIAPTVDNSSGGGASSSLHSNNLIGDDRALD